MTIQNELIKAGPFDGNDATTAFPFSFKLFATTDILVVFTDTSGVESDLVLDTDYSVALNADQEASPGGTVTYPVSGDPLATGEKLTLLNATGFLQSTDLQNGGAWNPQTVENALDRLTMLIQRVNEENSRALVTPVSDDAAGLTLPDVVTRASKYLAFNAEGEPIATANTSGSAIVSTFMETLLDDATAVEARATLGPWDADEVAIEDALGLFVSATQVEDALIEAMLFLGHGGSFRAYRSTITGTLAPIPYSVESWDTANWYDNTTNYRFTPQFAGYYSVSAGVGLAVTTGGLEHLNLRKNGTVVRAQSKNLVTGTTDSMAVSDVIYCNGTTDYIDVSLTGAAVIGSILGQPTETVFSAHRVRLDRV